jgi:hypothetical protein
MATWSPIYRKLSAVRRDYDADSHEFKSAAWFFEQGAEEVQIGPRIYDLVNADLVSIRAWWPEELRACPEDR